MKVPKRSPFALSAEMSRIPRDERGSGRDTPRVSVVIPVLNEERSIGTVLDALAELGGVAEVVVVDGGSIDGTVAIARDRGAEVISAERGRGSQLHAGATRGSGDILWFLHADTLPSPDGPALIAAAMADPRVVAGHFRVRFDGRRWAARWLTVIYRHLRLLGCCYGDSAIFVRRDAYEAVGGFRPYPIFEDLDLLRRVRKRGRFVRVPGEVVTSSRRFEGRSFALTFARWAVLQVLYWLGVPPPALGRFYHAIRHPIGQADARPQPASDQSDLQPDAPMGKIS